MRICCFLCYSDHESSDGEESEVKRDMEGEKDILPSRNGDTGTEDQGEAGDGLFNFEGLESELENNFFVDLPGMANNPAESSSGVGSKRDLERVTEGELGNNPMELSIGTGSRSSSPGSESLHALSKRGLHENLIGGFEVGESSGSCAMGDGTCDRDLQSKRAKVDFGLIECHIGSPPPSGTDSNSQHTAEKHDPFACGGEDNEGGTYDPNLIQMDLSDDLLHMVFSFLGHLDLCRAAMVCKQWRSASAHEDFWRSLSFDNRQISVAQFENICNRYSRITEVNFCGITGIHSLVMKAVSLLSNLEILSLGRGVVGDTFFSVMSDCQMLRSLTINDCTLTNIQEISISHDRLQRLQVTKCRILRISIRCPQLEFLSLKRSNMGHAVLNCPVLRELDMGACHKLPDAAIRSAVTACPQLESLDMSNCSCLTDETLREIAIVCDNLRILNVSYCPNISLESVRLPMLTDLKLENCEGITSASMAAVAHSYMLEVLQLDNCSLLTSVSLELSHLKSISLVHCRKFVELNLRCPMLSSLTVWRSAALHCINITSNALRKLVLQKQESLTSLSLKCQYLQEVDLSDCESLTNSICEVFNDGGGCPILKSLVLDNCESISSVKLCSTSLVSLSLAGCRAVAALDLKCPNLEQIRLDGCDHLERASFSPVGLQSLNLGICPKLSTLSVEAPSMVLLELKGCGVLSDAAIDCPMLGSLDASFCSQLKDDCLSATTISCSRIESLILMSCPSIGPAGLVSLERLENLIYLDLSYTFLVDLQPVFKSCKQLKVLKLQACKYLDDSSLEALYLEDGALPALCELDLSYGTLCQSAIEELLARCTHLTHVSLNGCVNMHDLDWSSTKDQYRGQVQLNTLLEQQNELPHRFLQNLNCVGCPNIKRVHIPASARCEIMTSLNLSLSINLKEVHLACSNLCFLNLSNCSSLEVLELQCPRLTSLFLQSCNIDEEAVISAISSCTMLETLDIRFCPKIGAVSMASFRNACHSLKRVYRGMSTN